MEKTAIFIVKDDAIVVKEIGYAINPDYLIIGTARSGDDHH
jgi:hypothetical protein